MIILKRNGPVLIQSDELHIWRIDLINALRQSSEFYPILSDDERKRANCFYHRKHQENFIFTRGVLRKIIGDYLKKDPSQIEFSYNKYGKPFIKKNQKISPFNFNLSHSEDIALCIISKDVEAGIDIEKVFPLDQCVSIAKQFFSKQEINALKNAFPDHQLRLFYQIWTRKEAFVKAIGVGLGCPLKDFDVISEANKITFFRKEERDEIFSKDWNFKQLSVQEGYEAAIAYQGLRKTLKFFTYL